MFEFVKIMDTNFSRHGVCVCVYNVVSVKEKLTQNTDNEISATSLRISLLCPVSVTIVSGTLDST